MTTKKQGQDQEIKSASMAAGFALVALLAFGGGWYSGQNSSARTVELDTGEVLGIGEVRAIEQDVEFELFWDVWEILQEDYLRGPVEEKDLLYGALEGLVTATEDPYTTFFDPQEASEFQTDLEGKFEGIGAEIGIRDGQLTIISPLDDSPAINAGVRAGDAIFLIDGVETAGMSVEQAVRRIRGPKSTEVVLTVAREGVSELFDIPITRGVITVSSVDWEVREDGIAVIELNFFNEDAARAFNEAVIDILPQDVNGIVLDLRNNPGGFLDRAVTIAGDWVGNNTVVIERTDDGVLRPFEAQGIARLDGIPTVVLVNAGSASASEIVAGALLDYEKATIVGEQTFGKGSVQEYRDLSDGSGLKITVAEWLTPQGRSIQDAGVTPSELVELTLEDFEAGVDPQMDRAIELLTQ